MAAPPNREEPSDAEVNVAVFVPDLMDSSKVRGAFPQAKTVRSAQALAEVEADVLLVDLSRPGAAEAAGGHIAWAIGFVSHVDDAAIATAQELGVNEVLPRSLFFKRLATNTLLL